ncbi:MAG: hypothetical protein ACOC9Y_00625 [Chloroflexota bacterium]
MSGEEWEGQQRETCGLDIVHCQSCSVAIPTSEAIEVGSQSPLGDHDEPLHICLSCWEPIHEGVLDLLTTQLSDEGDIRG